MSPVLKCMGLTDTLLFFFLTFWKFIKSGVGQKGRFYEAELSPSENCDDVSFLVFLQERRNKNVTI